MKQETNQQKVNLLKEINYRWQSPLIPDETREEALQLLKQMAAVLRDADQFS